MKAFLQSPCDRMMCKREKHEKARIFKNTCVFTVRLHLGRVDKTGRTLAITLFFSISEYYSSCSASRAPWRLDLEATRLPKSVPKRSRNHLEAYWVLHDAETSGYPGQGLPEPGPPLFGDQGARAQNARFASKCDRGVQNRRSDFQAPLYS